MSDTKIAFSYTKQFQRRAVTNSWRSSMLPKIQSSNNLIQLGIAYQRTLEWVKVLPTSYPTEALVLNQHAAKQNSSWDKFNFSGIQQENVISTNLWLKKSFCDDANLSTLSKTIETLKIHAIKNGVSTIAIPKINCGLDQMNLQEVVKLLHDIFAYADVQIVVYTLEENGVHALSAEGDAELYADDEIERNSEEILLENLELETDFTRYSKSCQPTSDEEFPVLREKDHNTRLIEPCLQYPPKEHIDYVKEIDFQYSDNTDEEMILLIDMLVDARDFYSQHYIDVGKTRQKLHVTLKPNVQLKWTQPSKIPSHLKKLEKLLTQLKDADIIREMGDGDQMGSLFVSLIILTLENDFVKLMIDERFLN